MTKNKKESADARERNMKDAVKLAAFLLVVWGFYRLIFKLPDEVEELIIKPIIWLGPVVYFLRKEKAGLSSVGFTRKNLFPAVYLSLGLGLFFTIEAFFINYLKRSYEFGGSKLCEFTFYFQNARRRLPSVRQC